MPPKGIICTLALLLSASGSHSATAQEQREETEDASRRCVETDNIEGYKVESDERVRLIMKDGSHFLLLMKRHCPQLHFHRYITYTPVNGRICASADEIRTRAGLSCRIGSIEPITRPHSKNPQTGSSAETPGKR